MQQKYALPMAFVMIGLMGTPSVTWAQPHPYEMRGNRLTLLPLAGSSTNGPDLRIYWYSTIMRLDYGLSRAHQSLSMRFEHTL